MLFDLILLIILLVFIILGLALGFVHTLGSILGTFAGAFIAGFLYDGLGTLLEKAFGHPNLMKIFAFIFLFLLVNRFVGFIFYILDAIFHFLTIIPFLKTINRLLGAILGFFEGLLFIGLSLFVIARFPISLWFTGVLESSRIAPIFIKVSGILQWMLPEVLKQLQSVI